MSAFTISDLLDAKRKLEQELADTRLFKAGKDVEVIHVANSKDADRVKDLGLPVKVETKASVPPGKAWLLGGANELLGWMDFETGKAYVFTPEQLDKNRRVGL